MLKSHTRMKLQAEGHLSKVQQNILTRVSEALQNDKELEATYEQMLQKERTVSLRTIDWLVTNYSKRIALRIVARGRPVFVHDAYRTALGAYRRRHFDPFCRATRERPGGQRGGYVTVIRRDGTRSNSSIAQLNFFEWAHRHGVLQYAQAFADSITEDMNAASARQRARRRENKNGRRMELSAPPRSMCQAYLVRTSIAVT